MARPLSDEKRTALLSAAIHAIAASGVAASTLKIAKAAGVAEGTLFRYFPTKEDLLNKLYLDLKGDLVTYLTAELPWEAASRPQFRHLWDRFIDWGTEFPEKHAALRHLEIALGPEPGGGPQLIVAEKLQALVIRGFDSGSIRPQPVMFMWGVIQGIANVVLDRDGQLPTDIQARKELGWKALWGALATKS